MPRRKLRLAGLGAGSKKAAQHLQADERRKICAARKDYRLFFLIRSGNRGPVRAARIRSISTS